ncbi:hypothetical protein PHG25p194nc [Aeromonas phage 25]|uniref:Uncharacterized protein n=1 Tax=Aeromonas phage 25 TaxID=2911441 RepID=Q19CH3_9CAUD|nr:hypothetical protein PHG25p194nc [Aeromonas phage 25]ABF72752.1 hypothetical protein PHG25p194nc [Aeromonas phage 25]
MNHYTVEILINMYALGRQFGWNSNFRQKR